MTKEERIKRYETIVKWGTDYLDAIDGFIKDEHRASLDFDRDLLEEYIIGLGQLKTQKDT
jgi:hypothetical protein